MDCYSSYVEIDCQKLCNNIHSIQLDLGPGVQVIPVLKCNAYALGAVRLAQEIAAATDVTTFAVAQVGEAVALRQGGIKQDLLVLSGVPAAHLPAAIRNDILLPAYSVDIVRQLAEEAQRQQKPARFHIKVETGLNRLGVKPGEELQQLIDLITRHPLLQVAGVYSHFVDGERAQSPLAKRQYTLFQQALEQLAANGIKPPLVHLCNTGASEWYREALLGGARIGRRLYMGHPSHPAPAGQPGAVEEVASWRAQILYLRQLMPGDTVGYDEAFRATKPTTVAVISVGYGDGLDERLALSGAAALVGPQDKPAPYLSICMDQALLDVTGIPCQVGDEVTLYGRTSGGTLLSAQQVAALIGHEGVYLYSRLGDRIKRVYLNTQTAE